MANQEIELCYYAEIGQMSGLDKAMAIESHEQWEYRHPEVAGKVRVRKTETEDGVVFMECLKIPAASNQSLVNTEYETEITEEYFKAWIALFGTTGVLKNRYTFLSRQVQLQLGEKKIELPAVKFEVDVLKLEDGRRSKWCKIDIEIDHLMDILEAESIDPKTVDLNITLSELPFEPSKFVSAVTEDEHERAEIKAFWKRFELTKE